MSLPRPLRGLLDAVAALHLPWQQDELQLPPAPALVPARHDEALQAALVRWQRETLARVEADFDTTLADLGETLARLDVELRVRREQRQAEKENGGSGPSGSSGSAGSHPDAA